MSSWVVAGPSHLLATFFRSRLWQPLRVQELGLPEERDLSLKYGLFATIYTSSELQEYERRSPGEASDGPVMNTSVGATEQKTGFIDVKDYLRVA